MSKNLSAKYYQENKEGLQKNQNLSKEEKEKDNYMVVNATKVSEEMKKKINWLSIAENITK